MPATKTTQKLPGNNTSLHHLGEGHALVLFAILSKSHSEIASEELKASVNIDKLPAATRPWLLELVGWTGTNQRANLTKLLRPLLDGGYIIEVAIHDIAAQKANGCVLKKGAQPLRARLCYEVNTVTTISNRGVATTCLTLLEMAAGKPDGCVAISDLIKTLKEKNVTYSRELEEKTVVGDDHYRGKLQELERDGRYIEYAGTDLVRPRLRVYLERRYLDLLQQHPPPSDKEIKNRFVKYINNQKEKVPQKKNTSKRASKRK